MDYIVAWFVFLLTAAGAEPTGYIPPQDVLKSNMSCGLPGAVVGVQVDTLVNPTTILFPDPGIAGLHCTASIAARVQQLQPGRYEIATTDTGRLWDGTGVPYIGIDPHVSVEWIRALDSTLPMVPRPPAAIRLTPPGS